MTEGRRPRACSPRSTTWRSPSRDLDAAVAWYQRRPSGPRSCTARSSTSDGVEEALVAVADSYVQLLTPTSDDSPVAPSSSSSAARGSTTSATG